MLIAIPAVDKETIASTFGRCEKYAILDSASGELTLYDNTQNYQAAQGAGIQTASNMIEHGIEAVISKHVGPKAFRVLNAAKVNVYLTEESHMKDALQKLQAGEMQPALKNDVEGHHQ